MNTPGVGGEAFTLAERQTIVDMYRAGASGEDIAQAVGRTPKNPARWLATTIFLLRRSGYDIPHRQGKNAGAVAERRVRAHERVEQVRILREAGESYSEIGRQLGISGTRVQQICAQHGFPEPQKMKKRPGPYRRDRDAQAELVAMYERGDTWGQMAAALGLTVEGVRYRLHQAGVMPNRRRAGRRDLLG